MDSYANYYRHNSRTVGGDDLVGEVNDYRECKWCSKSKEVSEDNFPKLRSGNYSSKCRECVTKYKRDQYLKRREDIVKTERRKLSLGQAKEIYKNNGAELLSGEFINKKTTYTYKCSCGNIHQKSMESFIALPKCPKCHVKNLTPTHEVRKFYESIGMKFLDDEYIRIDYPHRVICVCGREVEKTLDSAKKGRLCWHCGVLKNSGQNSSRWDPELTDEDRLGYRSYPGYYTWRRKVLERDGYRCVKCGDDSNELHAHHIIPHSIDRDKRIEISNGASLCVCCHRDIHKIIPLSEMSTQAFIDYVRKEGISGE